MAVVSRPALKSVALRVVCSAILVAAVAPVSAEAERPKQSWSERILALHNEQRAQVGAPPLRWDETLAAAAAAYAPQLARLAGLQHSPRSSRRGQGENLWRGSAGTFGIEESIGAWIAERQLFRAGIFPAVSPSGDGSDVNHYSQMIWPATTHVGCAAHRSGRWDYLVCRYSPRGNIDGQRVP
ncbi:MAG: CAP domain-containing protein [Pseudomonadota bacterium]|nr:CAP domain-containing protein [Pseudomonadota bacterium]